MKSSGTTYLNDITSFLCGYVYVVVLCREAEQRLGNHTTVTILQNLSTHSWGMARNLSNWKLRNRPKPFTNNLDHYMASSASEQDDPNLALWLATRARRMEPSCPFGTTHCIPQANFPKSHVINPLLTKFAQSRWLDIGLVLFLRVYGPASTSFPSINTQKNNLVPRVLSLPRESTPVTGGHVSMHANSSRTEGGSST